LKVKYVSIVDWEVAMDPLRCSPNFHGQPHYDCALIQLSETKIAFVQLIFFFTCNIPALDETFQFALIQLHTAGIGVHWIDQDFDLIQVKAISHAVLMFIPMKSII
ncbi:hypothetical protein F5141DRAFT_997318, partial [Pisolithus sp. B1]